MSNAITGFFSGLWKRVTAPRAKATADFNASSMSRRMSSWLPTTASINSLIYANGETIRSRARDAARKNGWAAHALDVSTADGIGTGIMPICGHKDKAAKDEFAEAFLIWTDEADANQSTDFYGIQAQAWRAMMQDGECFVRLRWRKASSKLSVRLQLQVLEADYVPLNKNEQMANGNSIRGGIEFNAEGDRVAYWMHSEHPGEMFGFSSGELVRVPADEVFHLFRPIRPGQVRGLSWFTPILSTIWDLEKCEDAALLRMQIGNMMALVIKKKAPMPSDIAGLPTLPGPMNETDSGDGTAVARLEAGATIYLEDGEEPWNTTPPDAGANYDPFVTGTLRRIAAGLGLTYNKLTGDNTKENFSSMRGGELGYRRLIETIQHQVIVWQLCRPLLPIFLEAAMLSGAIKTRPISEYRKTEWQPPVWPWIDPLKDIEAAKAEVRSGFNSRTRINASRGLSSEQTDREQEADNKRADAGGVKYDSDGRQAQTGAGRPPEGEPDQQPPPKPAEDNGKKKEKEVVQ